MKTIYKEPNIKVTILKLEHSIVSGSTISFGGSNNGFPDILDQEIEEKEWEIEF